MKDIKLEPLEIDRFDLDREAARQAELLRKYGNLLNKAITEKRVEKTNLEIIEFELSQEIRKNPKIYGITKDTDTVVFKAVKTLPEWQEQFRKYLAANEHVENLTIIVESVKQMGQRIRDLTSLWLNQYYTQGDDEYRPERKKKPLEHLPEEEASELISSFKPKKKKLKLKMKGK